MGLCPSGFQPPMANKYCCCFMRHPVSLQISLTCWRRCVCCAGVMQQALKDPTKCAMSRWLSQSTFSTTRKHYVTSHLTATHCINKCDIWHRGSWPLVPNFTFIGVGVWV